MIPPRRFSLLDESVEDDLSSSLSFLDDSAVNLSATLCVDLLQLSLSTAHLDEESPHISLRPKPLLAISFLSLRPKALIDERLISQVELGGWRFVFEISANFVDLLNSQQNVVFGNVTDSVSLSSSQAPFSASQGLEDSNFADDSQASRKERRAWTPTDDVVLISSWLNTSKDAVVGTEQKSLAFWKRIAAYYNASPKLAGSEKREENHCKNRLQKINDIVCKFCGAYEAANREKTSGQNENDVVKLAHEIFFTNHKKSLPSSTLGKSCIMTKSGVSCLRLKLRETLKRGRMWIFLSLEALKQLK
ncbi:hypothetical protein YC2023_077540 [Brassica napus]